MKNLRTINLVASVVSVLMFVGCVSAPGTYPTVPGVDDIPLTEETQKAINQVGKEQKYKIAVVPEKAEYTNSFVKKYGINKVVGDQVESLCSGLSMFEIVARQELDILSAEDSLKNLNSAQDSITLPKPVDGLLVYAITACNIDSKYFTESEIVKSGNSFKTVEKKVQKFEGFVSLKITLINTKNHEKLFTKSVSGKSKWDEGGEHAQLLIDAVNGALDSFIKQFAYDFSIPGYVIQTTGGGRWAKITLGTNSGLRFHSKVEFLTKDTNNQIRPFAYGEVREPNFDYSWVLVKDYKKAGVRNNTQVKVSANQSRTILENLSDLFIYGSEE